MALAPEIPNGDLSEVAIEATREGLIDLILGSKDGLTVIGSAVDIGPYLDPARFASHLENSDLQHFNVIGESTLWGLADKYSLEFSPDLGEDKLEGQPTTTNVDSESPWKKPEGWVVVDPDAPEQTSLLARFAASSANAERFKQEELLTLFAAFEARYPQYAQELRTKLEMANPRRDGEHWLTTVQVKTANQEPIPTEAELNTVSVIVAAMLGENVMSNFSVRTQQQLTEENPLLGKKPDEYWFDVLLKYGE